MNKLLPLWIVVVLLVGGCASGGRPDWADSGKSKAYPSDRYLTGIGTASELEVSKDRARANLAKIFSVKIDQVTEDVTKHGKRSGSAGSQIINEARVERIISSRTEHVLTGARIAETWQGPKTRAYYSLAVMPRLQASNNLKQEITRLDNATRTYVKRAQGDSDILRKVRAASIAVDAQVARVAYQRTLRIVDSSGKGIPPKYDISRLNSDLERLLRRVRIEPLVIDDSTGTLRTSTSAALSMSGFQVSDGDTAEFVLDTRLSLENIGYRDKWYWSRGVLQIALKEKATGRERGSVRWAMKAAGHSTGDAEQRIATKADSLLKRQLRDTIVKFAIR